MTNAEKLAKDTEKLAHILLNFCLRGGVDCESCPLEEGSAKRMCMTVSFDWKEWLESEAK